MKKIIAMLLALVMIVALASVSVTASAEESFKAGLICLHDENSGYDANFINGFKAACEALGVEGVIKTNIDDTNTEGYDAALELADDGCKVVFSDSYGHGSYLLQAAQEAPEVQFTSCTLFTDSSSPQEANKSKDGTMPKKRLLVKNDWFISPPYQQSDTIKDSPSGMEI